MKLYTPWLSKPSTSKRRGLALAEIAFAVIVGALLLGGAWRWASVAYDEVKINSTVQLARLLLPVARGMRLDPKEVSRDNLKDAGVQLPADLQAINEKQRNAGIKGIFNMWGGAVWTYSGNAAFWGLLEAEHEVTLVFEDVPVSVCPAFVREVMAFSDGKPLALFFARGVGEGQLICLGIDSYCKKTVLATDAVIKDACHKGDKVLVGFTYLR